MWQAILVGTVQGLSVALGIGLMILVGDWNNARKQRRAALEYEKKSKRENV